MPGPAPQGISIFALDPPRLARFYESVVGFSRIHESKTIIVLESSHTQLVIHETPSDRASSIVITTPPQRRESALKFFFTVKSLSAARLLVKELGGEMDLQQWSGPGFVVSNAVDPEGNQFHLRENILTEDR